MVSRKSSSSTLLRCGLVSFISLMMGGIVMYLILHSFFIHSIHETNLQTDISSNLRTILPNKVSKDRTVLDKINTESPIIIREEVKTITTDSKKKIAYAITVTKDSKFIDGALVLGYSALKVHDKVHGYDSKYDAELVAFVTPTVVTSRPILEVLGWKVLERQLPVSLSEIENKEYMQKMKDSGCCGADEFLKLWAYTLVDYHRVVHLDMDSVVFGNMDEIYDLDKEMLFTGDWNMKAGSPAVPAQGGFLVIRPSVERFEEYRAIIRKGDHGPRGWGGSGIGNFWGGTTIQGIIPYFYHSVHPGESLEMNRCVYNFMADNPYRPNKDPTIKVCIDKQPTCEDCRLQNPELIKSAHFTICQKPWTCTLSDNPRNMVPCKAIHKKWFQLRDELERSLGISASYRVAGSRNADSLGMCGGYGDANYIPIPLVSRAKLS